MTKTVENDGPDPVDIAVGVTLRRLRKARDMSQQELGGHLGITFQQVQKYEKGSNRISASMMVRAAKALKVQPSDLLPRTDAEPLPPVAQHLSFRGAEELLEGYAAIPSSRHRRALLSLVRAMRGDDGKAADDT